MLHTLQGLVSTLLNGFTAHLEQWDGWAALIAAALFGFRGGTFWMPVLVAVIINPTPYGLVANLIHGRATNLNAVVLFTTIQIIIAFVGFGAGRLLTRLR
ncbi:hypothetical protein P7D22_19485 [Lichenihabitans sp. Uapishka_5]|uniref:hypothetical protein n=1 Tax=Lichenihabitans sp. Uapishka_5 TaxID=3037302 RepID=UPI0029E8097B|nr:hypothetical protein [Lichenihabitans sp. Uapishka_5]MDX7953351.1 hypothetical protein [Lichenihabitans sp. Uapishka_5]